MTEGNETYHECLFVSKIFLTLWNYFEEMAFCLDKKESGGKISQCRSRLILEEWRKKGEGNC